MLQAPEPATTAESTALPPLDLHELAKFASREKDKDLELWSAWKDSGEHPDAMRPLLKQFRPLIRSQANRWAGNVEIPSSAIHAEFQKQFVHAMRTYDPSRGAALGTWAIGNMRKASRFIATYQNAARIGERRFYKVGKYEAALAELQEEFGREPSDLEVAERMGWSEFEVGRLRQEKRKAFISGMSLGQEDPGELLPSREGEVLHLVKFELSPEERLVYDYTVGDGGRPKLKPGEIARQLNMSPSKISRLRSSIAEKIGRHI